MNAHQNTFITTLSQLSVKANQRILKKRKKIAQLEAVKTKLTTNEKTWLAKTARSYKINDWQVNNKADWQKLLSRVDIVPTSLLLAQAALESAWGKSRFAKQGNNYFGQWCYEKGCGIVPLKRPAGRTYEVRRFSSIAASVNAYIKNLNTNRPYRELRAKRAALRAANESVTGYKLAAGLSHYSQLGERYVGIIRGMIKRYHLGSEHQVEA